MFPDSGAHGRPLAVVEGTGCGRQERAKNGGRRYCAGRVGDIDLVETVVKSVKFEGSVDQL